MSRKPNNILTPTLKLVPCSLELLDIILSRDDAGLTTALGAEPVQSWSIFGMQPFQWTRDALIGNPAHAGWLTYLIVHRTDLKLIGTCGFKGKPDPGGRVEIGYEIAPDYRLRGLATETARALTQRAFSHPEVKAVLAHTLASENESGSVLRKVGLRKVDELEDPEEGAVWQWRITRDEFRKTGD